MFKTHRHAVYQENVSAEIRGEFSEKNLRVNFAGGFVGAFFLAQTGGKNPQQNAHWNLGASRPKLALQGSGQRGNQTKQITFTVGAEIITRKSEKGG